MNQNLFPLDCTWWLRGNVIDNSVDAPDFVDYFGRHVGYEGVLKRIGVGGHAVGGRHRSQSANKVVSPGIPHNTNGSNGQKYGKSLPNVIVETSFFDLL